MSRGPVLLTALAALAWPAAATAQNPCANEKHGVPARAAGAPRPPLLIGDSSELLAVAPLARLGVEADARGCRQVDAAIAILAARRRAGTLPRVVILAVGANGLVTEAALRRARRAVGPRRKLGLVTTPKPYASAQAMRSYAARHPRETILIDWARSGLWAGYGDPVHIGSTGEAVLARFIARRVHPYTPPRHPIPLPEAPAARSDCGRVGPLELYVVRGRARTTCALARRVARSPHPELLAAWHWFDWTFVGSKPWTDVFARLDGRVILALRPPAPAPTPGSGPPAPSAG